MKLSAFLAAYVNSQSDETNEDAGAFGDPASAVTVPEPSPEPLSEPPSPPAPPHAGSDERSEPPAAFRIPDSPPPSQDMELLRFRVDSIDTRLRENERDTQSLAARMIELELSRKVEHVVVSGEKRISLGEGLRHPAFPELLDLCLAGEEAMLIGPSGCGKTTMAEQVAEAVAKLRGGATRFASVSCSGGVSESHFFGRMIPVGPQGQFEFVPARFLELYETGGVFLLDEVDACDENVAISLNAALGNGFISVPARYDRPVARRHPEFICIAAANTFGRGADRLYVARNQLDEATLDRFRAGTIEIDYDRELERRLCPDEPLRTRLWRYRDMVQRAGLRRIVSTRFIAKAYAIQQRCRRDSKAYGYRSVDDYIDAKLMGGWPEREIVQVRGSAIAKA